MIHPGGTIPFLSENLNRCPILPRCNMNGCRVRRRAPKGVWGSMFYIRECMGLLQKRRKLELLFLIILIDFFGMRP